MPEHSALFAPDWRAGSPYQRLLGDALQEIGWRIEFLGHYRRFLPLARGVSDHPDASILHLHWPEAYHQRKGDRWDEFRQRRYPVDLKLARKGRILVVTAHNLHAHNRERDSLAHANMRSSVRQAQAVIAHSENAATLIAAHFEIPRSRVSVMMHGDLSVTLPEPMLRSEARRQLGLTGPPVVLMFGTIEPYKGIEEIIALWKSCKNAQLVVVGRPFSDGYEAELANLSDGARNVIFNPGWMSQERLHLWLSAADAVVFNYRTILTSGAACLARSWGIPLLIPERLTTVDLCEPSQRVLRFTAEDFASQVEHALSVPADFTSAADWRTLTDWRLIASSTAALYSRLLAS